MLQRYKILGPNFLGMFMKKIMVLLLVLAFFSIKSMEPKNTITTTKENVTATEVERDITTTEKAIEFGLAGLTTVSLMITAAYGTHKFLGWEIIGSYIVGLIPGTGGFYLIARHINDTKPTVSTFVGIGLGFATTTVAVYNFVCQASKCTGIKIGLFIDVITKIIALA